MNVIKSYYNFGKALEDRYDHYKKTILSEQLRHCTLQLEAENVKINAEKADIEDMYIELLKQIREEYTRRDAEKTEFKARIEELEKNITDTVVENAELGARIVKGTRYR
ncbi:hypothetical protein RclHR1_00420024 [Rhizophagus clarus]|uniref:Uncharacterized protein n=1 Tax=Rhizophagus clarus TaxID=94130 RepID=A0A2Z6RYC8_9GLOM|nr:hypothetical protein RclHR1_00420024 [Rhizophagus clarus]